MKRLIPVLAACLLLFALPAAKATTYTNSTTGQQSQGSVLECSMAGTPCGDDGIAVAPAVQNAAYSSGNALGNLQAIPVARNVNQPSGILNWFSIVSKGGSMPPITVYTWDTNPAGVSGFACNDKAAFTMGSVDRKTAVGIPFVLTPSLIGVGDTATYAINQNMGIQFKNHDAPPTTNIYVCLVVGASVTPASTSDIVEKIGVTQD